MVVEYFAHSFCGGCEAPLKSAPVAPLHCSRQQLFCSSTRFSFFPHSLAVLPQGHKHHGLSLSHYLTNMPLQQPLYRSPSILGISVSYSIIPLLAISFKLDLIVALQILSLRNKRSLFYYRPCWLYRSSWILLWHYKSLSLFGIPLKYLIQVTACFLITYFLLMSRNCHE